MENAKVRCRATRSGCVFRITSMKTLILVLAGLLAMAVIALAQDYVVLDRTADAYDRVQIQPDGTLRVVDAISRETGVPSAMIEEQRTQYGLGYGGLLIANSLAAETGRPVDEIVGFRQNGRGWGEIARQYNVNLGNVVNRVHRADVAFTGNTNVNTKRDAMKAAKFVNGHDARDGKLDGTGPGHGRGHLKAATVGSGNGHGNGKANGKAKGHGKH